MKKVVQDLTSGGIDWQREKWQSGLGSKFIHQGEKNAAKYADEVIVLSKGVQDYFKETYGRETHFIPNGVNRPQIREASLITDKFGLKKDSYILFLGRLVPEKGIRYLVEAFKNVKTDKKLVIAGGSSDTDSFMEELKELAKGDDRILFTGFVQGAMLDELYSNAYIYTLPSDLEGMKHIDLLVERYPSLESEKNSIISAYLLLEQCYVNGGKLLVAGNGGSAADAEHIVGELMKGFKMPRKPRADFAEKLMAENQELGTVLAENLQGALPAIALDGHPALSTAYMNDCEPLLCFAQQVNGYGKAGDILSQLKT